MQTSGNSEYPESQRFFFIVICSENITEHYTLNFNLLRHKMFTLTELDNMVGYEREIYTNLLIADIKKKNENKANG